MKFQFNPALRHPFYEQVSTEDWTDWRWQMRHSLRTLAHFQKIFQLSLAEQSAFEKNLATPLFQIRVTPYYASLAAVQSVALESDSIRSSRDLSDGLESLGAEDPLRRIFMPRNAEFEAGVQAQLDPLGERQNMARSRLIHRYSDRVLFLVTDVCSVYCRFCTRKHFTGQDEARMPDSDYQAALEYIRTHPGIREVILSGGDPLTLSDEILAETLRDLREIPHVELIRIGSRMTVVNPFRISENLVRILQGTPDRDQAPVFFMTHYNHPRELTLEAKSALRLLVNGGIPVMNQMVLLNGVNNHPAIVQALSRRLLNQRVKPYYMFQCDPSQGTDHLRTSVDHSLEIQRDLWGHLSGLAMPTLALDIPSGGGKASLVPNFQTEHVGQRRSYEGWDGVKAEYISPPREQMCVPTDSHSYAKEWEQLKAAKRAPSGPRLEPFQSGIFDHKLLQDIVVE